MANLKERNVLFNNALITFYLLLYGVRHMIKGHSDSERGNLLPPHGLVFPISSEGSFICIIPGKFDVALLKYNLFKVSIGLV